MAILQDDQGKLAPFWTLLEQRMTEMVVTTEAIRHNKLQSNYHHQQTHKAFYKPDGLPVAKPTSKH